MTCVVGLIQPGTGIIMGADSIAISEESLEMVVRTDPKIFRVGEFLIGCAGSFRVAQVIRHSFKPPKFTARRDMHKYMVTSFVDELKDTMLDHGTGAENEEDGSQSFDGALLVAVRGNLFVIDEDFQVGEHADGYAAIGSGGSVALGALHATDGYLPHDKRVIAALKASERFCAGVRGPFITQTLPFDAGKDKKKRRQQ